MSFFKDFAVPIGGALISAYFASSATDDANDALSDASEKGLAATRDALAEVKELTAEQRAINSWALERLKGMTDGSIAIEDTPGYQHRLDEGIKATERVGAANGMFQSGRTAKELLRFGQGHASSEYDREFARVAQLAGLGAGGVSNAISVTDSTGSDLAKLYATQGAGAVGIAGANHNTTQSIIQNVTDAFNRSKLLDNLP